MAGTLVFLEHHGDELLKPSLAVLSKAAQLGGDVSAVLVGSGVEPLASEAGTFGAGTVYVADDPRLEAPLPQPRVDVLASSSASTSSTPCSLPRRSSARTWRPPSPRGWTPGSTGS